MQTFVAKRVLQSYRDLEREIDNQIERVEVIDQRINSVGSPNMSDMPKNPSPAGDRLALMIAEKLDEEEKLRVMITEAKVRRDLLTEIVSCINGKAGPDKKYVVLMKYIDCQGWDKITEALFGAADDFDDRRDAYTRRVFRLHKHALNDIDDIINKRGYKDRLKACGCL